MAKPRTVGNGFQSTAGAGRSPIRLNWIFAAAAAVLIVSFAVWPINRDEGQYVAATALMRSGLPYRDFAYLQTPLQPLLLMPLAQLPAGFLLVASRLFNALCAFATLILVAWTARRMAHSWAAALSVIALALSEPFLFAGSVARNDALPMALLAGAIALLCRSIESESAKPLGLFAAGLLMGLAVSAKLNFALPAAAALLFLLLVGWRGHARGFLWFGLGILAGLLPTVTLAAAEPQRFAFGVFTYNLTAPQQYLRLLGHGHRLTPGRKLLDVLKFAAQGSILPALFAVAMDRKGKPVDALLDLMIVAGLIAAYLPDPAYAQYLVPLLPPLFVRLASALERLQERPRSIIVALICLGSCAGAVRIGLNIVHATRRSWQLAAAVDQGRTTARLAHGQPVVTLSPERVAGVDVDLDRGFVTGPFLYRTEGELADRSDRLGFSPNWRRLDVYLSQHPPAAVLTGPESRPAPPIHRRGLDGHLSDWAIAHGFRQIRLPGRGVTLWVSPFRESARVGG